MSSKRIRDDSNFSDNSKEFSRTSELEEMYFKYETMRKQLDFMYKEKTMIIEAAGKEVNRLKNISQTEMDGMKKSMNNALEHIENQNRLIHFLKTSLAEAESKRIVEFNSKYIDAF